MERDRFSRSHPAVTFIFFTAAICLGAMIMHPAYIIMSGIAASSYYCLIKGAKGLKFLMLSVPLFVFISLFNPLVNHEGERILCYVFGRPYTWEALVYGMVIAGMLIVMLLWAGCFNHVMTSDRFTVLFGGMIPTLSMLLVMILRLVPNMMRKTKQIAGARKAIGRGVSEKDPVKKKAEDSISVASSLLSWSLEGGAVTADAMKARGYGAGRRSSYEIIRFSLNDTLMIFFMAGLFALVVMLIINGGTGAEYTPVMDITRISGRFVPGFAAYGILLMLPTIMHLWEDLQWRISRSGI